MPRKLTILGVLAALVLGVVGLAQSAGATPAQSFCSGGSGPGGPCPAGASAIGWDVCYDNGGGVQPSAPTSPACGAGTSDSAITNASTPTTSWQIITTPVGSRLTLPVTYSDPGWTTTTPALGATTGTVTARTNIACDTVIDILADQQGGTPAGNTGSGAGGWPGNGWGTFPFKRGSVVAGAVTGGPNGTNDPDYTYVDSIKPMPFPDKSIDVSRLLNIWIGGSIPFPIPPNVTSGVTDPNKQGAALVALNTNSTYVAGVTAQVALLGGDPNPPAASPICLDSPQDSVSQSTTIISPPAGAHYRWTAFQSAADLVDGQITRILITRCVIVAATGSCSMGDADGDLVPDGVEAVNGTSSVPVSGVDSDSDGATDYDEIFQFTNPLTADTDGDGFADQANRLAGFTATPNTGCSAATPCYGQTVATDNCPVDANPTQLNSDSLPDLTNTPNVPDGNIARTDVTNPHQDSQGDACDTDKDNDGLNNVVEAGFRKVSSTTPPGCVSAGVPAGCPGAGPSSSTLWCQANGATVTGATIVNSSSDPLNPDSDSDGGLDGRECQFGSDPTSSSSTSCNPACAGPTNRFPPAAAGDDPDGDFLFPDSMETYYRTQNIIQPDATEKTDLEQPGSYCFSPSCTAIPDTKVGNADGDSDGDLLNDGVEVKWYLTAPSNFDTDTDGCSDGREAADVNGSHKVDSTDLLGIASHQSTGPLGPGRTLVTSTITSDTGTALTDNSRTDLNTYGSSATSANNAQIKSLGYTADIASGSTGNTAQHTAWVGSGPLPTAGSPYTIQRHAPLGPPGTAYAAPGNTRRSDVATYDFNKDGAINSSDLLLVAKLQGAPGSGACAAGTGAQPAQLPILRAALP